MSAIVEASRTDSEPHGRKIWQVNDAARRLFLELGFVQTSMDAVAREAGVSKATLYSYFPSKEALFEYLIAEECSAIQQDLVVPNLDDGLEPALRRFAHDYVRLFADEKQHCLVRVMAKENTRFPDMCMRFYEIGPLATIRRVAQLLLDGRDKGLIAFPDAMIAATQFLSLVRGDLPLRAVLGIAEINTDTIDREIEAGLSTFMRAHKAA